MQSLFRSHLKGNWFRKSLGIPRGPLVADWQLLLLLITLTIYGTLSIYSSTLNDPGVHLSARKQIVWSVLGLGIAGIFIWIDYRKLIRIAYPMYGILLGVLFFTIRFGEQVHGASRWLSLPGIPFRIQPSEFAKIVLILFLVRVLMARGWRVRSLREALPFILGVIPIGFLVFRQPDLGTALGFLPVLGGLLYLAGVSAAYYLFVFPIGLALLRPVLEQTSTHPLLTGWGFLLVWGGAFFVAVAMNWGKKTSRMDLLLLVLLAGFFHLSAPRVWEGLRPHQRTRVITFVNPGLDPRGAGYHVLQARIALGSGGMTGQGWGGGTQSRYRFLPEYQTDFAFAALGEQWGFLGAAGFLILFLLLILKGTGIAADASKPEGAFLAMGIVLHFAAHLLINVGVCLGVLPVTGLPLSFLSYGGSAALTNFLAVGLLFNVRLRKYAD